MLTVSANLIYSILPNLRDRKWRLNNIYNIKAKDKSTVNFSLNPLQEQITKTINTLKHRRKPIRIIILKPRQIGCTTFFCIHNFDQVYWAENQFCAVIAHKQDKAREIFKEIIKFQYDNLDPSIKFKAYNDAANQIGWRETQSQIVVTSDGHGITPNLLHLTEVARMKNPKEMIGEALQGVPKQGGEVVMESTANGQGGFFYDAWMDSVSNQDGVWTPIFLKWYKAPDYELSWEIGAKLTDREKELLKKHGNDGLTKRNLAFRRWVIEEGFRSRLDEETGLSGELLFQQNYPMTPEEAFIAPQGICFFNLIALQTMERNLEDPSKIETIGKGYFKIFKGAIDGKKYLISCDTAFGASKDYSVATILRRDTREMVATLRGKYSSYDFARYIVDLGKFYNNALIAVERNMGQAVLNEVINHLDYREVYYHSEFDEYRRRLRKPGFPTNSVTRIQILNALERGISSHDIEIRDNVYIQECKHFGLNGTRWEAITGNDDCVMSLAIGYYLCRQVDKFLDPPIVAGKPAGI